MKVTDRKTAVICTVITVILVGVFFFYTVVSGISELYAEPVEHGESGDIQEYYAVYAQEVKEVRHSFFGIFNLYSDKYYVTSGANGLNPVAIKADEKWFSENFSAQGLANSPVKITAMLKLVKDNSALDIAKINADIEELGRVDSVYYADVGYTSTAVMKIVAGILLLTAAITFVLMMLFFRMNMLNKVTGNMMCIFFIIQLLAFVVIMIVIN